MSSRRRFSRSGYAATTDSSSGAELGSEPELEVSIDPGLERLEA